MEIKGYKAFNKGLVNRYGKVFEEGACYEKDIVPSFGNHGDGYHFCIRLEDTLRYFNANEEETDIAEITAYGDLAEGEDDYWGYYDMYSTNKIRIDHILTREEILKMFLKMEPGRRVERFIDSFLLDEVELSVFQKVMVEDVPKTVKTYGLHGPNSVDYDHTSDVKRVEAAIKRAQERNKKLSTQENHQLKLK